MQFAAVKKNDQFGKIIEVRAVGFQIDLSSGFQELLIQTEKFRMG